MQAAASGECAPPLSSSSAGGSIEVGESATSALSKEAESTTTRHLLYVSRNSRYASKQLARRRLMKGVSTGRQKAVSKALTSLLPQAPYSDLEPIRAAANDRKLRGLPPSVAVWLATIAHVRHVHSDYDALLAEGYDRDSARFFVVDQINGVLTSWRATRLLDPEDMDTEEA